MRRAAALALGLVLSLPACRSSVPRAGKDPGAAAQGNGGGLVPPWLPAYTREQQALLAPLSLPIQLPAQRVYPDLNRFGYADNRRLVDPNEAFRFTKMVAAVLEDSPRFYAIDTTSAENANPVAQYGPPGPEEADGWWVVTRDDAGLGQLTRAPLTQEARVEYDEGYARHGAGDFARAATAFRGAIAKSPKVPALHVALAEALLAAGQPSAAREAYEAALEVDPTYATAHIGVADLSQRGGDLGAARRAIAKALAYHPRSPRAMEVADKITSGAAKRGEGRLRPFAIFIEVDAVGAIHVASAANNPAQIYASCRAIVRYEPDVRAALFNQPPDVPYHLSIAEEVVCLESALGAYLFDRAAEQTITDAPDPGLEALLHLAQEEGLSGYALFEILGRHRPERARAAPPEVHRAVLSYVDRYVLGGGPTRLPEGSFTAAL